MGSLDKHTSKDLQIKHLDLTEATTTPTSIWTPTKGKITVHNVMVVTHSKSANSFCTVRVEALRKGTWIEIAVAGSENKGFGHLTLDYKGMFRCQELRVRHAGTASSYDAWITVTGGVEK